MKSIASTSMYRDNLKKMLFFLLIVLVAACDKLEVDPDVKNQAELKGTTIFIQPNSSVIIDLAAKVNSTQSLTVAITSPASKGKLVNLGKGLMQYEVNPGQSTKDMRDAFAFTLYNEKNEPVKKDSIIIVQKDSTSLPSGIYPTDDIVFGVKVGTPINIDVLKNDVLSTYTANDVNLAIYSPETNFPPYFGTASVTGSSILYTPGATFAGVDKLIYTVTLKANPSVQAFGYVLLIGEAVCAFNLENDVYVSSQEFTEVRVPILDNDQLCTAQTNFSVTVSKAPTNGTAFIENDLVVYRPSQLAVNGFLDSLTYKVTIDGTSKNAKVYIKVNTDSIGACVLTAVTDVFDISNSANQQGVLDVLQNDILCGREVEIEIINAPIFGTATIITENGKKKIEYKGVQDQPYDKLTYRISNGDKNSEGYVLIKRSN